VAAVNWGLLATFAVVGFCCMCVGWSGGRVIGGKIGHEKGKLEAAEHYRPRIEALIAEVDGYRSRWRESRKRPAWALPPPPPAFITPQAAPEPSPDTASLPAVRLSMADTGEMRAVTDAWIAAHTTGDAS
jgi:hypothetical protein